jgi:preprotein translocase subunit SecG
MYQAIIVIHILLGLGIIGLILMQQGKGADAGAGFGGGASGSVFGAQGAASFLSRTTAIFATLFFITSLALAWLNANKSGAAVDFMGSPAVEKEAPDVVPNVDGANGKVAVPDALPESKPSVVTPPPVAVQPVETAKPVEASPAAAPETTPGPVVEQAAPPKTNEVKVEETKAVEEQKPEPKPEKPAKTHKSAKTHHKKN